MDETDATKNLIEKYRKHWENDPRIRAIILSDTAHISSIDSSPLPIRLLIISRRSISTHTSVSKVIKIKYQQNTVEGYLKVIREKPERAKQFLKFTVIFDKDNITNKLMQEAKKVLNIN